MVYLWPAKSLLAVLYSSILADAVQTCRYIPGDDGWPNANTWAQLNETVGGRLIATVPQASVCHTGGYASSQLNETECKVLQTQWDYPQIFEPHSGEIMNPYFQNQSCDPFTATTKPCELGNYVSYSINVASAEDVVVGIRFSKENNVRLVIKNTGHDFLGKSTAKGALGLWMYNLKTTAVVGEYANDEYTGPAMKVGAGITGAEALEAAHSSGYLIVSGDCATVGLTGGYTQGGGHSPLTSAHGMAADQVLEWEVVTVEGHHLIATPSANADLYWALSGGGPGTFAVVLSMTIKVYPEGPVGTASLSFGNTSVDGSMYLQVLDSWWKALPGIVDTGATVIWVVSGDGFAFESFTAPNKTAAQVTEMMGPFLSRLDSFGIQYTFAAEEVATYYEHYNQTMGPLPYGNWPTSMLFNSRLVPRAIIEGGNDSVSKLTATMDTFVRDRSMGSWSFGCTAFNARDVTHPDNAVVSYWRDALAICITISLWDWTIPRSEMIARKKYMADVITPAIEAATVGSGAYLNEADPFVYPPSSSDWQQKFYGSNYDKLRQIKNRWDPSSLLYARTAVGSEDYVVDDNGRLCKA